ncbi:hypothetical protein BGW38_010897 [Lunasporangiospora selenospora]|uniref:Uncharacterized protein n=1 Tax=Lunasporangiospora selenospora TaxID=979761 RepID=A0A9P6FWI1_9FUNG|nr:hypothetical protein BGW38_010897 [Lunasporangiospora selenospora]
MSTPSHVRSSDSSKVQSNFALSFLPTFPRHNRQVIGYLSHGHGSGLVVPEGGLQVKPNKFTENEAFNTVLHSAVLQQQLEGWTHITDYRNPPPYGRIPTPEDIFGSVQIVDGKFQNSSYQRMPSHRIVSSNGLFQLSDHLHEKLIQYLRNL